MRLYYILIKTCDENYVVASTSKETCLLYIRPEDLKNMLRTSKTFFREIKMFLLTNG